MCVSGGRCVPPPVVLNAVARLNQSTGSATVTCMTGHRFPDGLTVKTLYCHADGSWDYDVTHCDGQLRQSHTSRLSFLPRATLC